MRCCPVVGSSKCERCLRKSMDCVSYVHRKRGRKPIRWAKTPFLEIVIHADYKRARPGDSDSVHISHGQNTFSEVSASMPAIESMEGTSTAPQQPPRDAEEASSNFLAEVDGLQPSSLLNQKATKGKFSMENILSIGRDLDSDPAQSPSTFPEGDPILKGIISYHIATSLFDG